MMRVRCIADSGKFLRAYEYEPFSDDGKFGRFGTSGMSTYSGTLDIGQEYLVMGIFTFQTYQAYLVDDGRWPSACPCQLFEIVDDHIPASWHFRIIEKDEYLYPFLQTVLGYEELISDKDSYEKLIADKDWEITKIYFRRKSALEEEFRDRNK